LFLHMHVRVCLCVLRCVCAVSPVVQGQNMRALQQVLCSVRRGKIEPIPSLPQ
jgi:hypothetical protein